jgi:hypothetical protein
MGDFGGSDYCAFQRVQEGTPFKETIITITLSGYLKDFMKRRAKITRKR